MMLFGTRSNCYNSGVFLMAVVWNLCLRNTLPPSEHCHSQGKYFYPAFCCLPRGADSVRHGPLDPVLAPGGIGPHIAVQSESKDSTTCYIPAALPPLPSISSKMLHRAHPELPKTCKLAAIRPLHRQISRHRWWYISPRRIVYQRLAFFARQDCSALPLFRVALSEGRPRNDNPKARCSVK
jgi:hypothetical protein